jgi:hypothetical protein
VLAPAAAGSVLNHPTDEDLSAGTLVELGDVVHWLVFCFFILWKVFAFEVVPIVRTVFCDF